MKIEHEDYEITLTFSGAEPELFNNPWMELLVSALIDATAADDMLEQVQMADQGGGEYQVRLKKTNNNHWDWFINPSAETLRISVTGNWRRSGSVSRLNLLGAIEGGLANYGLVDVQVDYTQP